MNKVILTLAALLTLTACEPPPANLTTDTRCSAASDCASDCAGFDDYSCSDKGFCVCKYKPADPCQGKCSLSETCVKLECGTNEYACSDGNLNGDEECKKRGYGSKTIEKCPDITRGEFAEMLYLFGGYNKCPDAKLDSGCKDIKDPLLSCKWAVLQEAKILQGYTDANGKPTGNCGPNDTMNRAAATKIVITAIDGLASYQAPATPTFSDVASAAWYFDYVEAASQLGLVYGYKDANGNLNGKFGPGDAADKCWAYEVMKRAFPSTTPTNAALAVALASVPTSQSFVKGESNAPALGIALTAGSAEDVKVRQLTVRVYADSYHGTSFSATGDTPADTVVTSVMLYDGNNLVAGPATLNLVDTGASGFVPDTFDYYKATFKDLILKVGKGSTKVLTVKLNLRSTLTLTRYLAVDVVPSVDIVAEDESAKTVTPTGGALNSASPHNPELTVVTAGTLTASSEGNPNAAIVVAGTKNLKVSRYRFHALREGFTINKVTVMNDTAGAFDTPVATPAVGTVTIKYPDVNGVIQTRSGYLVNGSIVMSNMNFYVPAGQDVYLEVYADVSTMAAVGESLSGMTFRLGLGEAGTVATFQAVGILSSAQVTQGAISNGKSVNTFTVRKSKPTFSKPTGLSTTLINGQNTLYRFTVSADSAGPVSFGRFVFDVTTSGFASGTTDNIKDLQFYRGSTLVSSADVNIYCTDVSGANATEIQVSSAGLDACDGVVGNGVADGTYKVIVSFNQEETVSAGSSRTFYLKAAVAGAVNSTDSISTRFATTDLAHPVVGILGTSVCGPGNNQVCSTGNGNTGRVYDTGNVEALFFFADEFSRVPNTRRDLIWSDKSSDTHLYPTVSAGVVTAGTGSYDWTNGYSLNLDQPTPHTLTAP